jgi:Tol biopolymer transport system component
MMSIRCRRSVAVAVLLVAAGCTSAPEGTDTTTSPPTTSSNPTFSLTAQDSAFLLDLRTGTQTPLRSTSGDGSRVRFDNGHYYAVSPDGSMVYWEDDCCSASDVAAVARGNGSQARRLDPTGPINYYAGGWSPAGAKIVYQRRDGRPGEVVAGNDFDFGDLVVEDMTSGRKTRIDVGLGSAADGWWYLAPTFSPDGRDVIFQLPRESSSGTKWDLWSAPVAGGERRLLVKNAAQATTSDRPVWAFVRPKEEFFDGSRLVIATADGFRPLVEALSGIFEPKMSPDGSRIAYQDGASIYVVDVSTAESSEVAVGRMGTWLDDDTLIVAPEKP